MLAQSGIASDSRDCPSWRVNIAFLILNVCLTSTTSCIVSGVQNYSKMPPASSTNPLPPGWGRNKLRRKKKTFPRFQELPEFITYALISGSMSHCIHASLELRMQNIFIHLFGKATSPCPYCHGHEPPAILGVCHEARRTGLRIYQTVTPDDDRNLELAAK